MKNGNETDVDGLRGACVHPARRLVVAASEDRERERDRDEGGAEGASRGTDSHARRAAICFHAHPERSRWT